MISKVLDGHDFGRACKYICDRKEAEVLEAEGVRGDHYEKMGMDFEAQAMLREHKKKACFHALLSFHPDDKVDKEMMKEIARKYLKELKIINTQYVIVLHTDKLHPHLHILANMVNYEGRSIDNAFTGERGMAVAKRLTAAYKLIPADHKDLSRTNVQALTEYEANKYKIYEAIAESLPRCRSMEDLEARLKKQGITLQYKYKSGTQEKQGISFKIGQDCIKGSKVDRQYSLTGLQKILEHNRGQVLEAGNPASRRLQKSANLSIRTSMPSATSDIATGLNESILGTLLNPLPDNGEEVPYIPKKRKRRR